MSPKNAAKLVKIMVINVFSAFIPNSFKKVAELVFSGFHSVIPYFFVYLHRSFIKLEKRWLKRFEGSRHKAANDLFADKKKL